MTKKHRKTLEAIFAKPTRANIAWVDIEAMFRNAEAAIEERAGSRVAVLLNDTVEVFHRPHPQKEAKKSLVDSVRDFLTRAGVTP